VFENCAEVNIHTGSIARTAKRLKILAVAAKSAKLRRI
jgi:hypothetical protein